MRSPVATLQGTVKGALGRKNNPGVSPLRSELELAD